MKIKYPEEVKIILNELSKNNYKGFIVGGCVRDLILNKTPNDWDITTNAVPHEMLKVFSEFKTIPSGIKHGTITIIINETSFEITTFRIDGNYLDNRRPEEVKFTTDITEDLKRRDFTINSIAFNKDFGIIDPFYGINDINNKVVRCVGNAEERFKEDSLRILRGIRFSVQLGFDIDFETLEAMKKCSHLLNNISIERIRDEFTKIILSDNPTEGIRRLVDLNIMKFIIPEMDELIGFEQKNPYHDLDVFEHTLKVLSNTESELILRLSALLHDIAKPRTFSLDENGIGHFYTHNIEGMKLAEVILKRLKFDNKTIEVVKKIIKEHLFKNDNLSDKAIKKFINRINLENLETFFKLQIADIKGSKDTNIINIIDLKSNCEKIINKKEPLSTKDLDITGKDIINMGYKQGVIIGEILNYSLEKVLENPELNQKSILINIIKDKFKDI